MKRGSALLIVLGMLSFMVVSAVGFSIYMRQGRLPSSYLRRNISARYLVKAALSNAIEDLDGGFMSNYEIGIDDQDNPDQGRFYGIHDDPYPGVGPDSTLNAQQTGRRTFYSTGGNVRYVENGDFWFKRVFCPFGLLPYPDNENRALDEPPLTVPTLTLEALAYLPPAIIDDVRKVSRLTRTAQWRTLPYEAGRYAYTAVNVSDLFDVNRLRADVARNSGSDRITLASLCARTVDVPGEIDQGSVDTLENVIEKMESLTVNGNVTPFTSIADFNVVARAVAAIGYAPFMDYIGKSSAKLINESNNQTANSLFITDTWFPSTNTAGQVTYDLASNAQPFLNFTADSLVSVLLNANSTTPGLLDLYQNNLGIGLACLYDYLDSDSIPISLAFPTTEAVPMVVGVGAPMNGTLQPQFDKSETKSEPVQMVAEGGKYTVERTVTRYQVSSFSGNKIRLSVSAMYPFKRMKATSRNATYYARGLLRLFLVPADKANDFPCRPIGSGLGVDNEDDFKANNKVYVNGVATFTSVRPVELNFNDDMTTQSGKQWIKDVQLEFDTDGIDIPIFQQVTETWTPVIGDDGVMPAPVNKPPVLTLDGIGVNENLIWMPRDDNGVVINAGSWKGNADLGKADILNPNVVAIENLTPFGNAYTPKEFRLMACVWIQVVDSAADGAKVVDMVPASADDDYIWCKPSGSSYGKHGPYVGKAVPDGCPLLPFATDYKTVVFNDKIDMAFTSPGTFGDWNAVYAVDPRYNHSPEDWFCNADGDAGLSDKWCTSLGVNGGSKVFGVNERDRDVFMFVSDQEYLQSIGELQFLPALEDLDGNANFANSRYSTAFDCKGASFSSRKFSGVLDLDAVGNVFPDRDYFWRTYSGYHRVNGESDADVNYRYANPFTLPIFSGAGGFRLNPYSSDIRVPSAALIGTPFDYYVASTNDNQRQSGGKKNTLVQTISDLSLDEAMQKYAFSEKCSAANLKTTELLGGDQMGVVDMIQEGFEDEAKSGNPNWIEAWNKLLWQDDDPMQVGDNNKKFVDCNLSAPLHGVDRKFLYSFWRECFDNRQQLFLVFVRAEPTAIGGGASGAITSAQLGGRAVALVWRDPTVPNGARTPRSQLRSCDRQTFRDFKKDNPPHRTRVLFYHQFD